MTVNVNQTKTISKVAAGTRLTLDEVREFLHATEAIALPGSTPIFLEIYGETPTGIGVVLENSFPLEGA